jgi:uracil-DNA glycosylase family 4
MDRLALVDQILSCTNCELHTGCTAPVPWSGTPARIAVIGEAPGAIEDDQGQPFVGPAGQLLRSLLREAGITEPVAYLNAASCFPHGTPTWDQVRACEQNKFDQLTYLKPDFVLLVGKIALRSMRGELDLRHGRSRPFKAHGYLCFGTYHPSAALRNRHYESVLRADLDRFAVLLAAPDWTDRIPATCAGCAVDAEWYEADSGLGWCRVHLPSHQLPAWQARQDRVALDLAHARAVAETQRDAGIARVEAAAERPWMDRAWDALTAYLRTHQEFFVDDFWAETALPRPAESRALGPLVQRAARDGLVERSGQYRKSVASNMTEKPVWTSHLYRARDRFAPTPTAPTAPAGDPARSGVEMARAAMRSAIDELTDTIAVDGHDSPIERQRRREHLEHLKGLDANDQEDQQ